MASISLTLRRAVVTGSNNEKILRHDDCRALRTLIDLIDYSKDRSMRRSMDRLSDEVLDIQAGQKDENNSVTIQISEEQLEHLYRIGVTEPPETVRIHGGTMRKLINLIEDTYDDWKKGAAEKPSNGKPEMGNRGPVEVVEEVQAT